MIDFNLDKYKNHKESLIRIHKDSYDFDFLLNQIDIDYANKITGQLGNETTNQFLKAISYRMKSVLFHYNLLYNINPQECKSSFPEEEISIRQNCLFDSIIFNTASLFDYYSCFIWYIIGASKIEKKLWNSLAKWTRNDNQIKKSKIGTLVDFYHREWIAKLFDYRAELIHYKDDWANETYTVDNKKLIVHSPAKILKYFKIHKKTANQDKVITIEQISLWVIENSLNICKEFANALKIFIQDNKKRESDVIQFMDTNDPEIMKEIIKKMKNNT
jgi:hypothetical protein